MLLLAALGHLFPTTDKYFIGNYTTLLFIHSFLDGHSACFQLLAVTVLLGTILYVSPGTNTIGYSPGSETA